MWSAGIPARLDCRPSSATLTQTPARGQVNVQLQALHDVARLGEASRVSQSLHEAAAGAEGGLAPLYVAHADALSSRDAVALDRVASGFAGLGLNLLAAEAAAEAASQHQAAGRRTAATAAQSKPTRSPRNTKARAPPPWTHASHTTSPPASWRSQPWPHADCPAKRSPGWMVVSVRTVDNTLHQVFGKLAVNKRADLRLLLAPSCPRLVSWNE